MDCLVTLVSIGILVTPSLLDPIIIYNTLYIYCLIFYVPYEDKYLRRVEEFVHLFSLIGTHRPSIFFKRTLSVLPLVESILFFLMLTLNYE
jgi:hypothetical protein